MIDEGVKAVALSLIILAGAILVLQVFPARRVEPFSEIGLLGPGMKIGDYPKTVLVDEAFRLYLYLGNHEGRLMYYIVYVKLGDKLTVINSTVPANAPIIATYEAIIPNGQNRTIPMDLSISKPMVNAKLIFELWVLDVEALEPKYHGRWVHLWLNVTAPKRP